MKVLTAARWEGNVRELRNLVESLVILTPHDEIRREDLPPEYLEGGTLEPVVHGAGAEEILEPGLTMEEIERRAILAALDKTGGNRTQAAEMLGIGLRTLQRKLKEYRLAGKGEDGA